MEELTEAVELMLRLSLFGGAQMERISRHSHSRREKGI
jgi:hypothetical protein